MLKVALIQMTVSKSKSENLSKASLQIQLAASNGAKLICLPECFNSPYGLKYFPEYCEEIPSGITCQTLSAMAQKYSVWIIGGSIPESRDGKILNTCVVYNPNGEIVGKYSKIHLFDIDDPGVFTFKESAVLTPGNTLLSFNIPLDDTRSIRVGIGICHDVRFEELIQIYTRQRSCELLIYPAAFNMTTGPVIWHLLGSGRAMDNQCYVGMCSTGRDIDAEYVSYGHSMICDPWGSDVGSLDEKENILQFEVDLNEVYKARSSLPIRQNRREDVYTITQEI